MLNSLKQWFLHYVPGPIKNRPKLTITLAIIGAIGTLGSGLGGFAAILEHFNDQPIAEDKAYITHQQFNTLIVPLIKNVEQMQKSINVLQKQVNGNSRKTKERDNVNESGLASLPKQGQPTIKQPKTPSLQKTLERVHQLQQEQRSGK